MKDPSPRSRFIPSFALVSRILLITGVCVLLFLVQRSNFLLFHSLVEGFIISIAAIIFLLTWNARRFLENDYFLVIGLAFPFIALLELLHALSYHGMHIFPHAGPDTATQLWIATRYLEAATLACAICFVRRKLPVRHFLFVYSLATGLILASIFHWDNFPVCFVEGQGLTSFKIVSEYLISFLYLTAVIAVFYAWQRFDSGIRKLLIAALVLNMAAEIAFTFYVRTWGLSNTFGHYLKIGAYYFMYKAIFESGMTRPFDTIFRGLKKRELELQETRDTLEEKVETRTRQLLTANERLREEIADKQLKTEELRESEEKYSTLIKNAMVGIFIVRNDTILYANPRFAEIFGYSSGELVGMNPQSLLGSGADNPFRNSPLHQEGSRHEQLVLGLHHDRHPIWVEMITVVVPFQGSPAILGNIIDVTRRKELEEMVRIQDKMASLGRVAAGMAHEIRNPLSGMNLHLSSLERLCGEVLSDVGDEMNHVVRHINSLKNASGKIEEVVKRVYDFSRPNTQGKTAVNVNHCLQNVMAIAGVTLRKQGVMIEEKLALDLPVCSACASLLEQLFLNLLTNASQILEKYKGEKRIRIESSLGDGHISIKIADSGPGVAADLRDKIFDPFFSTRKDGMGIGLSICYRIVKDHQGELRIDRSNELGGAEFIIILPLQTLRID